MVMHAVVVMHRLGAHTPCDVAQQERAVEITLKEHYCSPWHGEQ